MNIHMYVLKKPILHSRWVGTAHCTIHECTACAIDFSRGFWYGTLPCPITFESAKLLAASTRAVEWYKSHAHTSFLSEVIQIFICANWTWLRYICGRGEENLGSCVTLHIDLLLLVRWAPLPAATNVPCVLKLMFLMEQTATNVLKLMFLMVHVTTYIPPLCTVQQYSNCVYCKAIKTFTIIISFTCPFRFYRTSF